MEREPQSCEGSMRPDIGFLASLGRLALGVSFAVASHTKMSSRLLRGEAEVAPKGLRTNEAQPHPNAQLRSNWVWLKHGVQNGTVHRED